MLKKNIKFCGFSTILACDGKCEKAWGISNRPRNQLFNNEDDWEYLSDTELEIAPSNPETYEGGHGKPTDKQLNKWCARECERSQIKDTEKEINLRDFSRRVWNLHS